MRQAWIVVALFAGLVTVHAARQAPEPTKTREEILLEQVATLQLELAQASDRWAKCEVNGPASAQLQAAGQATAQTLMKSLAARQLTIDKDGKLVPLPPAAPK